MSESPERTSDKALFNLREAAGILKLKGWKARRVP